jgi:hypothetical protein
MPMHSTLSSFFWKLKMLRDPDHCLCPKGPVIFEFDKLLEF